MYDLIDGLFDMFYEWFYCGGNSCFSDETSCVLACFILMAIGYFVIRFGRMIFKVILKSVKIINKWSEK